jgi:type VI secretion system Hcp family effector
MKRKIIFATLVAGALIAAGTAYGIVAHTTAESQTIAACVAPDGGIRLAAATGACKNNETLLTWNSIGPAGPAGLTGPAGPNGQNGQNGQNGLNAVSPDAATATITVNRGAAKLADGVAVSAISHEIVSPRDAGSGAATGKRVHKPLTVTMAVGASTPQLINAVVTNAVLSSVVLTSSSETITLTNADISDYQQHGDTITLAFTYQKIEWTSGGSSAQDDLGAGV